MGGNISKKSGTKPSGKRAKGSGRKSASSKPVSKRKTGKKPGGGARRAVPSVTPKGWNTSTPLRPDRLTAGPRGELDLPVPAATDHPVRPVNVRPRAWTEKTVPSPTD